MTRHSVSFEFDVTVKYMKANWSRSRAWNSLIHLAPPEFRMGDYVWVPAFHHHENSQHPQHPYRKNHGADYWGWDVVEWELKCL